MLKLFFLFVTLGALFCRDRAKSWYHKFLIIFLFLTIALRHKVCFIDTYGYVLEFSSLTSIPFSAIKDIWLKDVTFWYFSKFISTVSSTNYTIWFAVLSILYIVPLYYLLKKYSNNFMISLVLFCCLGFALFSMTGLRQTLAMSCTMGALYCLLNAKSKSFVALVMLGTLFHKTAIVFLILYPIVKLTYSKKYLCIYLIIGALVYCLSLKYLPILLTSNIDSRFEAYVQSENSLNYSGLIRQVLLLLLSLFLLRKNGKISQNRIFLLMSLIGIFFQSMIGILPEMFRVSLYFSIANIFLLANALENIPKFSFIKYSVIILLIIYFITSSNAGFLMDYYFFFQDVPTTVYNNLIF